MLLPVLLEDVDAFCKADLAVAIDILIGADGVGWCLVGEDKQRQQGIFDGDLAVFVDIAQVAGLPERGYRGGGSVE